MGEDQENKSEKDERFYEPRNWDKVIRIEEDVPHEIKAYCGKCGHVIYQGDRFCTKCGSESRSTDF